MGLSWRRAACRLYSRARLTVIRRCSTRRVGPLPPKPRSRWDEALRGALTKAVIPLGLGSSRPARAKRDKQGRARQPKPGPAPQPVAKVARCAIALIIAHGHLPAPSP